MVQLSSQARKAALIEYGTARIHADSGIENSRIDDFRKDELMADYSRLQGGYLSDAVFGILDMESVRDVYDENGQLKVPVKLTFEEYHRNLQSILENMMNEKEEKLCADDSM